MLTGPDPLVGLHMPVEHTQDELLHNFPRYRGSPGPFLPSCFPADQPLARPGPQVQNFALPLVELHEVSVSPFLQPVDVPLDGSMTLQHISHSSHIDPWGTLLVTGYQPDFVSLITTLWTWLFSQFSIHLTVCSSSPYINRLSMRILWETASKALLKS
ncbi:hypothetical protein QYF61_025120, partial [Mycteria americana]